MCFDVGVKRLKTPNDEWSLLDKPVYAVEDLVKLFGSRTTLWRLQKKGFLRKLPGKASIHVPRTEVIRYLESSSNDAHS